MSRVTWSAALLIGYRFTRIIGYGVIDAQLFDLHNTNDTLQYTSSPASTGSSGTSVASGAFGVSRSAQQQPVSSTSVPSGGGSPATHTTTTINAHQPSMSYTNRHPPSSASVAALVASKNELQLKECVFVFVYKCWVSCLNAAGRQRVQ